MPEPERSLTKTSDPRWRLLRDAVIFHIKLAVDGLMDLVLSPMTLIAAVIGLVRGRGREGLFYEILRQGRRLDRWINLFGEADGDRARKGSKLIDDHFQRLEALIREQHKKGGMTTSTKERIDAWLDAIGRETRK